MKIVKVNVLPDPIQGPGYAIIALEGSSIESAGELSFSIARNQDGRFLGANGQWEPLQTWHQSQEQQVDGAIVRCWVGTHVVDALLANPQMQYRILVKAAEGTFQGIMRLSTDLFASSARVVAPVAAAFTPPPEPVAPVVDLPLIEPVTTPAPAAVNTTSPKKSMVLPLIIGLVALAVIGAGLWFFLSGVKQPSGDVVAPAPVVEQPVVEAVPVTVPVPVVVAPEPVAPCAVDALAQTDDDIAYLQRCVQSTPSTEQVLAVIAAGKAAKKCDLIQRLYAHAAQTGNSDVALAYAKEFDPLTFAGGCFNAPEPATAVYWYELYLQQKPDDEAIARRAKSLKE